MTVTASLLERLEFDPTEVDLRAFRLDHDPAVLERRIGRGVHQLAVDVVRQLSALDDGLDVCPFEAWTLDILGSTESELVRPVFAPTPPVDAAARQRVRRSLFVVDRLAVAILPRGRRHGRPDLRPVVSEPGDRQDVTHPAFDDLKLDRAEPRSVEVLAGVAEPSLRMQ